MQGSGGHPRAQTKSTESMTPRLLNELSPLFHTWMRSNEPVAGTPPGNGAGPKVCGAPNGATSPRPAPAGGSARRVDLEARDRREGVDVHEVLPRTGPGQAATTSMLMPSLNWELAVESAL